MKLHRDELVIFLDCSSSSHKKTLAYARSITDHIREYSYKDYTFNRTQWYDLLEKLNLHPKDLLNKADPKYQKEIAGKSFEEDAWVNILIKNPCLIKAPIAVMHDKAVLCLKPKDIYLLIPKKEYHF
jgi:arsenate reductase